MVTASHRHDSHRLQTTQGTCHAETTEQSLPHPGRWTAGGWASWEAGGHVKVTSSEMLHSGNHVAGKTEASNTSALQKGTRVALVPSVRPGAQSLGPCLVPTHSEGCCNTCLGRRPHCIRSRSQGQAGAGQAGTEPKEALLKALGLGMREEGLEHILRWPGWRS